MNNLIPQKEHFLKLKLDICSYAVTGEKYYMSSLTGDLIWPHQLQPPCDLACHAIYNILLHIQILGATAVAIHMPPHPPPFPRIRDARTVVPG